MIRQLPHHCRDRLMHIDTPMWVLLLTGSTAVRRLVILAAQLWEHKIKLWNAGLGTVRVKKCSSPHQTHSPDPAQNANYYQRAFVCRFRCRIRITSRCSACPAGSSRSESSGSPSRCSGPRPPRIAWPGGSSGATPYQGNRPHDGPADTPPRVVWAVVPMA